MIKISYSQKYYLLISEKNEKKSSELLCAIYSGKKKKNLVSSLYFFYPFQHFKAIDEWDRDLSPVTGEKTRWINQNLLFIFYRDWQWCENFVLPIFDPLVWSNAWRKIKKTLKTNPFVVRATQVSPSNVGSRELLCRQLQLHLPGVWKFRWKDHHLPAPWYLKTRYCSLSQIENVFHGLFSFQLHFHQVCI